MKETDLRISNLIDDGLGNYGQVNTTILQIIEEKPDNSYKPIPLTKEWLVNNCISHDSHTYKFSEKCVVSVDLDWIIIYNDMIEDDVKYPFPKYIHLFQNLVFALTREELTIK